MFKSAHMAGDSTCFKIAVSVIDQRNIFPQISLFCYLMASFTHANIEVGIEKLRYRHLNLASWRGAPIQTCEKVPHLAKSAIKSGAVSS